jgi:cytochrome b involved in lipid metabolism
MATFPHDYKITSKTCFINIDGFTYDISAWRNTHPGGAELLD